MIDDGTYYRLEADDASHIIVSTRTSTPFPSVEQAEHVFVRLVRVLDAERPREHGLLIDARGGPGRNDEAFESAVLHYLPRLFGPFQRRAVVVRTQAGAMQSQRLMAAKNLPIEVFHEPESARAYLRTGKR